MTNNPYQAPLEANPGSQGIGGCPSRRVAIRPLSRLSDGLNLLGDQYLLMVGVCFLALLINSVVPFNILFGPLACGVHLCLDDRARGRTTSIDRLFKGFDYFGQSLIATLLLMAAVFAVIMPLVILLLVGMGIAAAASNGNEDFVLAGLAIGIVPFIIILSLSSILIYVPFLFVFPLIVDQRMSAWQAVRASWEAAWKNLWGLLGMILLYAVIGMICATACYVPVFFVIPIQWAAIYLIYRDVFPTASDAGGSTAAQ